ncbi:MAG: MFS transporter, partial [Candidatus Omnitrophota bacterium]|nr:MFS transporter [Candidatus Omnitrophota bacterium]
MPPSSEQVRKSLRASLWDGVFTSGMVGFTQDYFIPFLLLLGAPAKYVALLSSLPNFVAALVQLKSPDITEHCGSRKKIINLFVFLQAAVLLPMAFTAFCGGTHPMAFILMVTVFTAAGAFATPAWGSLMSDLVPEKKRGEYFGWRNKILGFVVVGMSFTAGAVLHEIDKINIFYGFAAIYACASLFRFVSWYFLTRMYEPPQQHRKEHYFNIVMFLARIRESNFAKFVLFVAMLNFSVNLASPFFPVLMLRELHFNYLLFSVVTVSATLTIYLLMGRWGRLADQVGNLKVLRFTAPIIAMIPFWWIINRHPAFLIVAQIVSGFAWAGFNLCASNFIYDAVTPEKRTRCIAYFNVLNGLALCAGALLGGFLLDRLPPLMGYKILALFAVSGCLRMAVALLMPPLIKEVRTVQKISSERLFFSMIGMRPLLGLERK